MTLYTRPQIAVLLVVVVVAGAGLGVGHWRRTHPEVAARLEALDRASDRSPASGAEASSSAHSPGEPPPSRADLPAASEPSWRARPPKGAPPARGIDVNRATEDELRTLPGIGVVLAARIVQTREREGPFASLEDLKRVPGLGRGKLERIAAAVALRP